MERKQFIKTGALSLAGLWSVPILARSKVQIDNPPVKVEIIKEFVTAGHNDLVKVKQMVSEMPNLIYSRYDWGNGDFEEAIEGAGHVGNKDITNYLIERGARVNLFALTMLGKTDLVKPVLEEFPHLIQAKGPHGFTLLHHARVGGQDSMELYDYLEGKGLTETKVKLG